MGETSNVRTLFRNIRIQQPVRTLEPFTLAQRTAQSVDPLADLLAGARFGQMIGSIAGQREARQRSKLEREAFEEKRDRDRQIRDIANQSVTVNPETGRLELDPDNLQAGLLAGGFGQEALQIQQREDERAQAARAQAFKELQAVATLQKTRAEAGATQALEAERRRPPQPRLPTSASIAMEAAEGDPREAMRLMREQRRAGATVVNITPQGQNVGPPPKDSVWAYNPDGTVLMERNEQGRLAPVSVPIPGTKRHQELTEAGEKKTLRKNQARTVSHIVTEDVNRVMDTIATSELPTTGIVGSMLSIIPGTGGFTVARLLDTIRANVGFEKLQQMRQSSPTGGALGQVSDFENRLMQATFGALGQSQNRDEFLFNLQRVHDVFLDIVHGEGQGPPRKLSAEQRRFTQEMAPPAEQAPAQQPAVLNNPDPAVLDQMQVGDTITLPDGSTVRKTK